MKEKDKEAFMYNIKDRIKGRLMFIANSELPESEKSIMKSENEILLRVVNKVINNKLNPVKTIETVRGTQYKIGDTFCINGNATTKYVIENFPDSVTVRGLSKNPDIGTAWTVEAYVEEIYKPKKEKPLKEKKVKPVEIKVGDYFAIRSNNTVYKVTKVKKKSVFGTNELKAKEAPKQIHVAKDTIILKTKKDYKKQHKAERKHSKMKTVRIKPKKKKSDINIRRQRWKRLHDIIGFTPPYRWDYICCI